MIRQAALAVGVAIFVAIIGSPASLPERVAAFHRGWWIMAAIVALGLIPTFFFIRPKPKGDRRSHVAYAQPNQTTGCLQNG